MTEKIAIPMTQGVLSQHFGHCEVFTLCSVVDGEITHTTTLQPPPHEPGSHPKFLKEHGCDTIIAAGMGMRAQGLFEQYGIKVVIGAEAKPAEQIVKEYIEGSLSTGENLCDH